MSQWSRKTASQQLPILNKLFGVPKIMVNSVDGLALWTRDQLKKGQLFGRGICFEEILLRDEAVQHRCPKSHLDFLYTAIKVKIMPDYLPIINSISGSISYDPLKQLLWARCGSLGANIATLKLATDILSDKVDLDKFKVGLSELYGQLITATSDPEMEKVFYEHICDNLDQLGPISASDYWAGAFNEKCGDPAISWSAVCDKANKLQMGGKHNKPQQGGSKKYCRCLVKVAEQQPDWCLTEKKWFATKDSETCRNVYAICRASTKAKGKISCKEENLDRWTVKQLRKYSLLHGKPLSKKGKRLSKAQLIKQLK